MSNLVDTAESQGGKIPVVGTFLTWGATALKAATGLFSQDPNRSKPTWEEANAIAVPVAVNLTDYLIAGLSNDQINNIVNGFIGKSLAVVTVSNHADSTTNSYYAKALATEVPSTVSDNKYPYAPQSQLFHAIWLLALWQYGNFSRDKIKDNTASSQFYDLLNGVLFPVVLSVAPSVVIPAPAVAVNPITTTAQVKPVVANSFLASLSGNTVIMFLLVGAFVFFLISSATGKKR